MVILISVRNALRMMLIQERKNYVITLNGLRKKKNRHRDKYFRVNYKDKHKPSKEGKKKAIENHKKKFPEQYKAKNACQYVKLINLKNNRHHWSYNKEHYKDIIELSILDHNKLHRYIKYDQSVFMYRTLNGELLDTKQKHWDYWLSVKDLV